ncbi:MAG TPA: protein translocase subunit SecD [Candidatus Kapabacteria bacterium]|nr:protein translocase subunit SecD [Candidatus Kapabacteria bacterium]
MLNKHPLWKDLLVVFLAMFGFIYALPNLYPDDPALQITGAKPGVETRQEILDQAVTALGQGGIAIKSSELEEKSGLIRFANVDDQLKAHSLVKKSLDAQHPDEYVAALNLAPTTPGWLQSLGAGPMKLGLDLRGGVHFLMEVDMDKALDNRVSNSINSMRDRFRDDRIRAKTLRQVQGQPAIEMVFSDVGMLDKARAILRKDFREFQVAERQEGTDYRLTLSLNEQSLKDIQEYALDQNLTSIRNRVNELGVSEPVVTRQGANRIVIQLPGIQDTAAAKRIIGRAANLEFRMVDAKDSGISTARAPAGTEFVPVRNSPRQVLIKKENIVTGENVIDAKPNYDQNGLPMVSVTLDTAGGRRMMKNTTAHLKESMAVLFIESKPETRQIIVDGKPVEKTVTRETREAISVATIQGIFGSQFQITGLDSFEEAQELALLMRAGALAAPMYFVEERTVGPSLGAQNIEAGVESLLLGFALVVVFMIAVYKVCGVIANIALFMNLLLLVACMSLIPGAVLTLPGMAGIVLTLGMAVDANVLIFERIREEIRNGMTPHAAIHAGYDRAWLTIMDSNITTLLVGLVLFSLGSGPVKGFAVTLSIGILTSMFTAVTGSRAIINMIYGGRALQKLSI